MIAFEECKSIANKINAGDTTGARADVIKLLDLHRKNDWKYSPLLNHLIRCVGLYPYMQQDSSDWNDAYAANCFCAETGDTDLATLHIEQSYILKKLIIGENIVVSAPTSFGKSYIIDAYIAMRRPTCIVIIVPTVALADETRRRLARKFSDRYSIITTTDEELGEKNIFVFPQERAFSYIGKVPSIDLLVIDEFYKAGLDDERASKLLSAMIELGKIAKQKYFLGPNIDSIEPNPFTQGFTFIREDDFKTVVTKAKHSYRHKPTDQSNDEFKKSELLKILNEEDSKVLVYTSSLKQVTLVGNILSKSLAYKNTPLCVSFSQWLIQNYGNDCPLIPLVQKGVGLHNGTLHRSLAQIQIKLFEEQTGLATIISTSSIIEGVNTQAEKVVLWNNKISTKKLDYFTFRNIIGRAGRMLKYFIGYVYLLEPAPEKQETQLELPLNDEVICGLEEDNPGIVLNLKQKNKLVSYNNELQTLLGKEAYSNLIQSGVLKGASPALVLRLAKKIKADSSWPLGYDDLTHLDTYKWRKPIEEVFDVAYGKNVSSDIKLGLWAFSSNWNKGIIDAMTKLKKYGRNVSDLFKLERDINFKVPNVLSLVYAIKNTLYPWSADIRPFIKSASNVFLPKNVFILEEYGLPRMLSKKIHTLGIIDLEDESKTIQTVIREFKSIGEQTLISRLSSQILPFDKYILHYFYTGI